MLTEPKSNTQIYSYNLTGLHFISWYQYYETQSSQNISKKC